MSTSRDSEPEIETVRVGDSVEVDLSSLMAESAHPSDSVEVELGWLAPPGAPLLPPRPRR